MWARFKERGNLKRQDGTGWNHAKHRQYTPRYGFVKSSEGLVSSTLQNQETDCAIGLEEPVLEFPEDCNRVVLINDDRTAESPPWCCSPG